MNRGPQIDNLKRNPWRVGVSPEAWKLAYGFLGVNVKFCPGSLVSSGFQYILSIFRKV